MQHISASSFEYNGNSLIKVEADSRKYYEYIIKECDDGFVIDKFTLCEFIKSHVNPILIFISNDGEIFARTYVELKDKLEDMVSEINDIRYANFTAQDLNF